MNRFAVGARVVVGMSRRVGAVLHVDDEPSTMGEYVHLGSQIYSQIDRIVYFSMNTKAVTKEGVGLNFWMPAYRMRAYSEQSPFRCRRKSTRSRARGRMVCTVFE